MQIVPVVYLDLNLTPQHLHEPLLFYIFVVVFAVLNTWVFLPIDYFLGRLGIDRRNMQVSQMFYH